MSAIEKLLAKLTPRIPVEIKQAPKQEFEALTKNRIDRKIVPQLLVMTDKKLGIDRILSSVAGDTVILEGEYGKVFEVKNITAFKIAGTTQTFKFKLESDPGFTTETDVSASDANDKESDGGMMIRSGDRLVIEVVGAVASSTIDYSISYEVYTFNI